MIPFSRQVIVLAPYGRDAAILTQILGTLDIAPVVCPTAQCLLAQLHNAIGAVMMTDDALWSIDIQALSDRLDAQPPWSDIPFIVLAQRGRADSSAQQRLAARLPKRMTNVVYIERPMSALVLVSATEAALTGRRRQFQIRDELVAAASTNDLLRQAEARLARSHEELERLVAARTAELERANDELRREALERQRIEEALTQAQKMEAVGRLTGGIAHDFNNLLMSLSANLELADRQLAGAHAAAPFIANALGATRRGTRLASQLLAFSRTQKLTLQPVAVDDLIGELTALARHSLDATQELQFLPGAPGAFLTADPNQLELAILNLVSNGRDAMPAGGRITINTHAPRNTNLPAELAPGDYIELCVSDTGVGIAPELVRQVFDPFFTTKPVGKGTGLGLSQVWGITHQCGGTVKVRSVQGEGTAFCLFFPVALAPQPVVERVLPAAVKVAQGVGSGIKVLLVDDDDNVRDSLVAGLESENFVVTDASSGARGLELIAQSPPDLLLVDYSMPNMNGADLARAAQKYYPNLRVLVITGYTDTAALDGISNARVLHKPFALTRLSDMILSMVNGVPLPTGEVI
ncbi:ATP-binding protein [Robbsia sp. KACC 23696]|uniref:ATP-binding protein n=1 Tax=Robbsia sp. KACC 23696 TaxID=3149231 RepID=UPI00325C0FD7